MDFIFSKVLEWAKRECQFLLALTNKVRGFDFLSNSVFVSVVQLMVSQCNVAFGAGFPHVFHTNFLVSQQFLDNFEALFHSPSEVERFRSSASYIDFQKRWNVTIYFGLRYQTIAKAMEKAVQQAPVLALESDGFVFLQSQILWGQLKECWTPEIFLPALTDSFFKLSLQLIARFSAWVKTTSSSTSQETQTDHSGLSDEHRLLLFRDMERLCSKVSPLAHDYLLQEFRCPLPTSR